MRQILNELRWAGPVLEFKNWQHGSTKRVVNATISIGSTGMRQRQKRTFLQQTDSKFFALLNYQLDDDDDEADARDGGRDKVNCCQYNDTVSISAIVAAFVVHFTCLTFVQACRQSNRIRSLGTIDWLIFFSTWDAFNVNLVTKSFALGLFVSHDPNCFSSID